MSDFSSFWSKVWKAASRVDPNLYKRFKDLNEIHTPIDEVSFKVNETGDGINGYHEASPATVGIEFIHASHYSAWEKMFEGFDPFYKQAKSESHK